MYQTYFGLLGVLSILASSGLLIWNEVLDIRSVSDFDNARQEAIEISCDSLDTIADNITVQNKLVYASCPMGVADSVAGDPYFQLQSSGALYLTRFSEICQNRVFGGSCTRMNSVWSTRTDVAGDCTALASSPTAVNGFSKVYGPETFYASGVTVGDSLQIPEIMLTKLRPPGSCYGAATCASASVDCSSLDLSAYPTSIGLFSRNGNRYCNNGGTCRCSSQGDANNGNTRVSFQVSGWQDGQARAILPVLSVLSPLLSPPLPFFSGA
jgi:hypothetical protein